MPSGGYRQPSNPAPVSGPGPLARRTDGPQGGGSQPVRVPSGGAYGDRQNLQQLQQAAPVAASPGGDQAPQASQGPDLSSLTGFGAPSAEPGTPVTAGADSGAGPGVEALNLPPARDADMERLVSWLPALSAMANVPGVSKEARNLVRFLKSQAG